MSQESGEENPNLVDLTGEIQIGSREFNGPYSEVFRGTYNGEMVMLDATIDGIAY